MPTKTVTKVLSNFSTKRTIILAVNLPSSAKTLKWYLLQLEKEFSEAKRLYSMLSYFEPIEEKDVPSNSLLREFIGGSIFEY